MSEAYDIEKTFLYPINFNFILQTLIFAQWSICSFMGNWGLVMYNDGGEMMNECFNVGIQGGMADYLKA